MITLISIQSHFRVLMEFHKFFSDYGIGKVMLTSTILADTLNIDNPYFEQMEYVLGLIIL